MTAQEQLDIALEDLSASNLERVNDLLMIDYDQFEASYEIPGLVFYNPGSEILMEGDDVSYSIQGVTFRFTWSQWSSVVKWNELTMHGWRVYQPTKPQTMERTYTNNLTDLSQQISASNKSRGLLAATEIGQPRGRILMMAKLMRANLELAEAGEEVLAGDEDRFDQELADTIIVLLGIAGDRGTPIGLILSNKMKANDAAFVADKEAFTTDNQDLNL